MATISENLKTIKDSTADIKQAIIEKGGDVGNLTTYADAIRGIQTGTSSSFWTGHVDVEGLKAIGWDDDDIAYYQEHGVNWMEEDDEYHKVSDDNKALYGVLTADNIQTYKDGIVYLPKIDTSTKKSLNAFLRDAHTLVAIPLIDTKNATVMSSFFYSVGSAFKSVPQLNVSNATTLNRMFYNCLGLQAITNIKIKEGADTAYMFYSCVNLTLLTGTFKLSGDIREMFRNCQSLVKSPTLDFEKVLNATDTFTTCYALTYIEIVSLSVNVSFKDSKLISKSSLLYMINNEAATELITITLHAAAYARLANDPDIVAALSNHPNVSLASA